MTIESGFDDRAVQAAACALAAGELVAFPTETVYGLGARADDDAAVARVFAAKGRPVDHPLIVHVADAGGAQRFAASISEPARRLIQAFWPGPVTLVVERAPGVANAAAASQSSIALRSPAHPVARALLLACRALGVPGLAAPSANRFGRLSPTTAAHVATEFGDDLRVLDGGPCDVGIESAIVDCRCDPPVLLRPGALGREPIERVLGGPLAAPGADAPRASGTLPAHYAPRAALRLVDSATLRAPGEMPLGLAVYSRTRPATLPRTPWARMPGEPVAAARELFATLRDLDRPEVNCIWVERPPGTPEWEGVRDRLERAAAATPDAQAEEVESR